MPYFERRFSDDATPNLVQVAYDEATVRGWHGAQTRMLTVEKLITLTSGVRHVDVDDLATEALICLGITGRVYAVVSGTNGWQGWNVGLNTTDVWARNIGAAVGTKFTLANCNNRNVPVFNAATTVRIVCSGGYFISGEVRLAGHFIKLTAPTE